MTVAYVNKPRYFAFGWGFNVYEKNIASSKAASSKKVTCITDGKNFDSIKAAAQYYGISRDKVSISARHGKEFNGLKFAYR